MIYTANICVRFLFICDFLVVLFTFTVECWRLLNASLVKCVHSAVCVEQFHCVLCVVKATMMISLNCMTWQHCVPIWSTTWQQIHSPYLLASCCIVWHATCGCMVDRSQTLCVHCWKSVCCCSMLSNMLRLLSTYYYCYCFWIFWLYLLYE